MQVIIVDTFTIQQFTLDRMLFQLLYKASNNSDVAQCIFKYQCWTIYKSPCMFLGALGQEGQVAHRSRQTPPRGDRKPRDQQYHWDPVPWQGSLRATLKADGSSHRIRNFEMWNERVLTDEVNWFDIWTEACGLEACGLNRKTVNALKKADLKRQNLKKTSSFDCEMKTSIGWLDRQRYLSDKATRQSAVGRCQEAGKSTVSACRRTRYGSSCRWRRKSRQKARRATPSRSRGHRTRAHTGRHPGAETLTIQDVRQQPEALHITGETFDNRFNGLDQRNLYPGNFQPLKRP